MTMTAEAENPKPEQSSPDETATNPLFTSAPDAKIDQLEADLKKAQDESLRQQAEFENFRKRKQREMEEERRYAIQPFARDLLAVVDNLERAIEASSAAGDVNSLRDGVKLVSAQLQN